jgi:hypothetical protein
MAGLNGGVPFLGAVSVEAKVQAEMRCGMRCGKCHRRFREGWEFIRHNVVQEQGGAAIVKQSAFACNGLDGCDAHLAMASHSSCVREIRQMFLDSDPAAVEPEVPADAG